MSFLGDIGKSISKAGQSVAKNLPSPIRVAARAFGGATAAVVSGGFIPQPAFRRAFGLSPSESAIAETGLKVTRGITTAIFTFGAAGYASGPATMAGKATTFTQRLSAGTSLLKAQLGVASAADFAAVKSAAAVGPANFGAANLFATSAAFNGGSAPSAVALLQPVSPGAGVSFASTLGVGKSLSMAAVPASTAKAGIGFWDLTASTLLASGISRLSAGAKGNTPPEFQVQSPDQTGGLKNLDGAGGGTNITNAPASSDGGDSGGGEGSILAGVPLWLIGGLAAGALYAFMRKKKA